MNPNGPFGNPGPGGLPNFFLPQLGNARSNEDGNFGAVVRSVNGREGANYFSGAGLNIFVGPNNVYFGQSQQQQQQWRSEVELPPFDMDQALDWILKDVDTTKLQISPSRSGGLIQTPTPGSLDQTTAGQIGHHSHQALASGEGAATGTSSQHKAVMASVPPFHADDLPNAYLPPPQGSSVSLASSESSTFRFGRPRRSTANYANKHSF